jgi:indole-3-glycerol phosphate synthase
MTDILQNICDHTRIRVANTRAQRSLQAIEKIAERAPAARGFKAAIDTAIAAGNAAFITEIKKASPSAGIIRNDFNSAQHARDYEAGGATCLSVLTEPEFFQGSSHDITEARAACTLPVLRKDFIVDGYQIPEARAMGADCILIIMAALSIHEAKMLEKLAHDWGMDVLVEVHNRRELEDALSHMQSRMIGINNRNLSTLEVRLQTSEQLRPLIPNHITVICESGLKTHSDIARMRAGNMHGFLVGESLMKQPDITKALRSLRGVPC